MAEVIYTVQPFLVQFTYTFNATNQNATTYVIRQALSPLINSFIRSFQGYKLDSVDVEVSIVRPPGAPYLSVDKSHVNIQHFYNGGTRETLGSDLKGQYQFRSDSELLINLAGFKDLEVIPVLGPYVYDIYVDLRIGYLPN